ncbi:cytochrome P450 [Penicillium alfredii]|uniref:Cytochrome P450 n=1 Tax=Penicillium alfredii TaxID=1506179 RepID=A0A9W9K592_9EURO|nr:cytochrome P450 [Penicillium alfredii]KAJ5092657.1 cytochrome P450 [Penicillium alfredii]
MPSTLISALKAPSLLLGTSKPVQLAMDLYHCTTLAVFALVALYVITSALSWYRLRKFPVPSWLAHFSYVWLGRTTYGGKQYWAHRELHRKYGPLVRIGPNEIMTDDPDIIRGMSSVRSTFTRGEWYLTGRFNPYYDNLFTVLDNHGHKQARARLFAGYAGRDTASALEHGVDRQITRLTDLLRQKYAVLGDKAPLLDIGQITSYFTMDVITKLAFGQEFGYLEEKDLHGFLQEVHDLWPQMSLSADVPWIRRFIFSRPFLKLFGPRATDKHGFGALMGVSRHHVQQRFASLQDSKKGDMMESFISHGLTQAECEAEGLFTIIAGSESTAAAIRSVLVHTISCPRAYMKVKAEIRETLNSGSVASPISSEQVKGLSYLQAVVYEGIRMRPPILGLFPKVVPAAGIEYDGKFIPGGTNICMNTSSLLCSTSLFGNDVDVFRPERFTDLEENERNEMKRSLELAFGHGQNQCLGKHIAFMELYKITFELLRNFDFQAVSPWHPSDETLSYGVFLESNLRVKVTKSEL